LISVTFSLTGKFWKAQANLPYQIMKNAGANLKAIFVGQDL
jgi:hypothetical protein